MKKYIPCEKHWKDMFAQYPMFKVMEKFPLSMIKRKKLKNSLDAGAVLYILLNFNKEAWMPLTLNEQHFLIDGQHRFELAKQMCLEYFYVFIQSKSK